MSAILHSLGGLIFDATFSESHVSELEVTDNPVETGVVVSDHAYMKPLRLSVMAGVSDAVLYERANDPFQSVVSRSVKAYDLLTQLQKRAEPFDVQTGLKLYRNMLCISVSVEQTKDTEQALFFTADLREVLIVNTQTITYPPRRAGTTTNQAGATKDKGEQQGKQEADSTKKESILNKVRNAVRGS